MTKIDAKDVVPKDRIEDVHPETRVERLLRLISEFARVGAASFVVIVGFCTAVFVLLSSNPEYVKYHDGAWSLIIATIGAAFGYLFASKS